MRLVLLLLGICCALVPAVLWFGSAVVIAMIAPGDPVPQNAMALWFLIWLSSFIICLPIALMLVLRALREPGDAHDPSA